MEFSRLVEQAVTDWFNRQDRKPLLLRGSRQVGKSHFARSFARKKNLELIEINFERQPEIAEYFKSHSPKDILNKLSLLHGLNVEDPKKSLLFLDEVQEQPHVLASLRYFYEELPGLAVIATGSLLDFALADPKFSMPVGRVQFAHLYPLFFDEFLQACGKGNWLQYLAQNDEIEEHIHLELLDWVKTYMKIGGMPGIVKLFAQGVSLDQIIETQAALIESYHADFSKYKKRLSAHQIETLKNIFKNIPGMLGNSVKYTTLSPGTKSTDVKSALDLLAKARVVHYIAGQNQLSYPLVAPHPLKSFKLLYLDIGLAHYQLFRGGIDLENCAVFETYKKGAFAEQFIGQNLASSFLHYQNAEWSFWERTSAQSQSEVDYLLQDGSQIVPIEVKAGVIGKLRSLWQLKKENPQIRLALRFYSGPVQIQEKDGLKLVSLPHYRVFQTREWIKKHLNSTCLQEH